MADNNVIITVQLRDLATKGLAKIKDSIDKAESSTRKFAKLNIASQERASKQGDQITANSAKKKIKHDANVLATKTALNAQHLKEYNQGQKEGLTLFEKLQKEQRNSASGALLAHVNQKDRLRDDQEKKESAAFRRQNSKTLARVEGELKAEKKLSDASIAAQKKADKAAEKQNKQKPDSEKKRFDAAGRAAQKADLDFTQFNRTLFTTAAFIGTFAKMAQGVWGKLDQGAQLDRMQNQYKRLFGSSGISGEVSKFTTTAVDEMSAMQAAIEMGNVGIAKDSTQAAKIIAMAATASKSSNLDTAYGINQVVDALKSGSLANLEHLNLIKTGDPALKQHQALMQRATGIMAPAAVAQLKYNIILGALERKTKDLMFAEMDLLDVLTVVKSSFKILGGTFGSFLGKAIGGLVAKFVGLTKSVTDFFEHAKKNKPILEFTKNLMVMGTTAATLIATLGTIRLAFKLAGGIGLGGFGGILAIIVGIATSLKDLKDPMAQIGSMIKTVGAMANGVFQLVTSFFMGDGNMKKGIAQIDGQLAEFLKSIKFGKTDALELVTDVARAIIVVAKFIQDAVERVKGIFASITESEFFKNNIFDISKNEAGAWSRAWIDETSSLRDFMIDAALAVGAAWAVSSLLGGSGLGKAVIGAGKAVTGAGAGLVATMAPKALPSIVAGASGAILMKELINVIKTLTEAMGARATAPLEWDQATFTGAMGGALIGSVFGPLGALLGGAAGILTAFAVDAAANTAGDIANAWDGDDAAASWSDKLRNMLNSPYRQESISGLSDGRNDWSDAGLRSGPIASRPLVDTGMVNPELSSIIAADVTAKQDLISSNTEVIGALFANSDQLRGYMQSQAAAESASNSTLRMLQDSNLRLMGSIDDLTNVNNTLTGLGIWQSQDDSTFNMMTGESTVIPGYNRKAGGITNIPNLTLPDTVETSEDVTAEYVKMINRSLTMANQLQTTNMTNAMTAAQKANSEDGKVITKDEMYQIYKKANEPIANNTKPPKTPPVSKTGC